MEPILSTNGLTKRFAGSACVKDLDLHVPEGAVYGFLGPNGAGKTTTLKLVLGLIRPDAGEIKLFGAAQTAQNRLEQLRNVGSLIESPSYYAHLTGRENLRIAATLRGLPDAEIDRVLCLTRLDGQGKKRVGQYSLGMKQRLGIACALLGNPPLLLLDEPTNGLDPAGIQEMRSLIRSLPEAFHMTVVVSSHLLSEIDQLATHVGVIRSGELIFQDSLSALRARGRRWIALRTSDNARAAALLHAAIGPDGYFALDARDDRALAQLSLTLAEAGVGVTRMEERSKSLEEIFLDLIGGAVSL